MAVGPVMVVEAPVRPLAGVTVVDGTAQRDGLSAGNARSRDGWRRLFSVNRRGETSGNIVRRNWWWSAREESWRVQASLTRQREVTASLITRDTRLARRGWRV